MHSRIEGKVPFCNVFYMGAQIIEQTHHKVIYRTKLVEVKCVCSASAVHRFLIPMYIITNVYHVYLCIQSPKWKYRFLQNEKKNENTISKIYCLHSRNTRNHRWHIFLYKIYFYITIHTYLYMGLRFVGTTHRAIYYNVYTICLIQRIIIKKWHTKWHTRRVYVTTYKNGRHTSSSLS